ncbi:MAG: DUF5591 domain-containing protein, partial [Candidatus Hodarchaeota archaeon]
MGLFLIGRGHDGPARKGKYQIGEDEFLTPTLISAESFRLASLSYITSEKDNRQSEGISFQSLGSLHGELESTSKPTQNTLYVLPSLMSFDSLGSDASAALLDFQIEFLNQNKDQFEPAQCLIRVPTGLDPDTALTRLNDVDSMGVAGGVYRFSGDLGHSDFDSLMTRSLSPRNWLAVAAGRIEPFMVPLLYYLGFDVMDIGRAQEAASVGIRLWRTQDEPISKSSTSRFCSCSACQSHEDLIELSRDELVKTLEAHNHLVYEMILSESVLAFNDGKLRWLVESLTHATPSVASILRRIDSALYPFLEEFTPNTGHSPLYLIGPESYHAPAIRRFREKLVKRYSPPKSKSLILLLPCSARKPYSDSKSHRLFTQVVDSALGAARTNLSEVIVTSPLGVIPRELERVFPVQQYDLPVTGDWDHEETEIAAAALGHHLGKFNKDVVVVAHVSGGYLDIVRAAEDRVEQSIIYTSSESRATHSDALNSLRETLH